MSNRADAGRNAPAYDPRSRQETATSDYRGSDVQELLSIDPDIDLDAFAAEPVRAEVASVRVTIPERPVTTPPPTVTAPAIAPRVEETAVGEPGTGAGWSQSMGRRRTWVALCGLATMLGAGLVVSMLARGTTEDERAAGPLPADRSSVSPVVAASVTEPEPASSAERPSPAPASPQSTTEAVIQTSVQPASEPGLVAAGWLRVDAPIELDIELDGVVIGSSRSDRTMLEAGVRVLTFVNERLGYRTTERVSITGGQVRTLQVSVPGGMVSVNAQPWASVSVDGEPIGDTPLGNVAVAAGDHEVVFSHPRLGERRVVTLVRVGEHKRLNVDLAASSR